MKLLRDAVYLLLLLASLPWILWSAIRHGKYREGLAQKFLGLVPIRQSDRACFWFHAVSVGEVNLLDPILRTLERESPAIEIAISTTTKTGMAVAKQKYPQLSVFYCPLDFSWAVRHALKRIRPTALVLAELELWPNLIETAKQDGAKVAVINARLSEKSFRGYSRIKRMLRTTMSSVDWIGAQNATYAERFVRLGADPQRVDVSGSVKFDGANTDRDNPKTKQLTELAGIGPDDIVFLAGSTQEPEELFALQTFNELRERHKSLRLIIVPRHPERFDAVASLIEESGQEFSSSKRVANQRRTINSPCRYCR